MYYIPLEGLAMEKIDLRKTYQDLFSAKKHQFTLITIPHLHYITAKSTEDPHLHLETSGTMKSMCILHDTIQKFMRIEIGKDCSRPPLEVIFHSSSWKYLLLQPSWVTRELYYRAVQAVISTGCSLPDTLSFSVLQGGLFVQTLHAGSYDDIPQVLTYLREHWIPEQRLTALKGHHEVFLSTPSTASRATPRTILRVPVAR